MTYAVRIQYPNGVTFETSNLSRSDMKLVKKLEKTTEQLADSQRLFQVRKDKYEAGEMSERVYRKWKCYWTGIIEVQEARIEKCKSDLRKRFEKDAQEGVDSIFRMASSHA